jgi:hypothetical protein
MSRSAARSGDAPLLVLEREDRRQFGEVGQFLQPAAAALDDAPPALRRRFQLQRLDRTVLRT